MGRLLYKPELDVLRVGVRQQEKDQPQSKERMEYNFYDLTDRSVVIALEWERWRIPFKVEIDFKKDYASLYPKPVGRRHGL